MWYSLCLFCLIVEKLAMTGSKMVIISNSSRRASTTMEKMKSLGFDPSLFVGAITSGELTHQYLQRLTTISSMTSDPNHWCFQLFKFLSILFAVFMMNWSVQLTLCICSSNIDKLHWTCILFWAQQYVILGSY